ncbi:MAG: transketolase C-terminal domain-containing protein [Patescibacteria group bacterium]|nr:transketolase C-terminal domain-containing protein [Patescibacteria group bacterium]
MLINSQHLNPKIRRLSIEQAPIRQGFGEGLLAAAEVDEKIVGLCADLTDSTKMNLFRDKFPERFFQIGVAEQNLAAVASGMAAMGKIPFVSSYATFSPGRNWEQIRTTICYNDRPVKIAGLHAGVSVGPDGGSHQALEDIALTRVLPNMTVVAPADAIEAKKATEALAKTKGPAYLRLAREATPLITTDKSPFILGQANLLRDSEQIDVGLIACGTMVYQALMAAEALAEEGIEAAVLNVHTIKPLDRDAIVNLAHHAKAIVTAEEHQQAGGLGGAVAELLATDYPVPIEFVGVDDKFGQSGAPMELLAHYGLDSDAIKTATKKVLKRKGKR